MKTYSFYLKEYLENRPTFFAFIRPQEAFLFSKNRKLFKMPVLDFGCGDGFFAKTIFEDKKIEVGLDIENERTKDILNANIYKKINFYRGEKIPYPNDYFRTVFSNCVLEHIPNLKTSLSEIYRVLKPDGYFIVSVMTDKWNDHLFGKKILGDFYVKFMKKIQRHENLLTIAGWRKKFKELGFVEEKIIGYLSENSCKYNDLFHYFSFPSLISYLLFRKWNLFPKLTNNKYIVSFVKKNVSLSVDPKKSAALFFVLKKTEL